ncbi:hypothetical protein DFAR_3340030 [Desulfarculales bacterium]
MALLISANLCPHGGGLTCFTCCPPIRPVGYDHLDYRGSLSRLFNEAGQELLASCPARPVLDFSCPDLGFLDSAGRQVDYLYHPSRHGNEDLRLVPGLSAQVRPRVLPPDPMLHRQGSAERLAAMVESYRPGSGAEAPPAEGQPLGRLCDAWETHFWRLLIGLILRHTPNAPPPPAGQLPLSLCQWAATAPYP